MTNMNLPVLLPFIFIAGWAIFLLLVDLWVPKERKGITAVLAALGCVIGMVLVYRQNLIPGIRFGVTGFNDMVVVDGFAIILEMIFLTTGLVVTALSFDYMRRMKIEKGEFYSLMLFSISGMILLAQINDLIILFLGLELLSIPLYVLAGFARPRLDSEEASLKYFFIGAFSTGFLLYGIALIFGASGTTNIPEIIHRISAGTLFNSTLMLIGAGFLLVGLGFKVASVPFHMWAPDVYQGSPTPVTTFMSVGVKIAVFAALMREFLEDYSIYYADLTPIFLVLSVVTMLGGNLLALAQTNIKRLLAYTSIASAGYLLMAFVPYGQKGLTPEVVSAMVFYFIAYAITSFGAWAVVIAMEKPDAQGLEIDDYAGLGKKYPWLAISFTLFLFSYAGIPLTIGFWGKYYLFRDVMDGGYPWLAAIGVLASVISVFYYLRVVFKMFMVDGEPKVRRDIWLTLVTLLCAGAVFFLALEPNWLMNVVNQATLVIR
jgi:NADH-quinone oxidoreductase subunit N